MKYLHVNFCSAVNLFFFFFFEKDVIVLEVVSVTYILQKIIVQIKFIDTRKCSFSMNLYNNYITRYQCYVLSKVPLYIQASTLYESTKKQNCNVYFFSSPQAAIKQLCFACWKYWPSSRSAVMRHYLFFSFRIGICWKN